MSIVSSEIVRQLGRSVRVKFTDHNGESHVKRFRTDNPVEQATKMEAFFENALEQRSWGQARTRIKNGEDSLTVANDIDSQGHTTFAKTSRYLIYQMMKRREPEYAVRLESLLVYINANYTDGQITSFLGITQTQLDNMRTRINKVITSQTGKPADLMAEYETLTEDW